MTGVVELPAWAVLVAVGVVLVLAVGVVVTTARLARGARADRRRAEEALRAAEAATAATHDLRAHLGRLERSGPVPPGRVEVDDRREYVITGLGREREAEPVPALPAPVFADVLLRESVVRVATVAAGVRRALSPEVWRRVRGEMRREVKRARRQRRADVREARREVSARRRAAEAAR